MARKPDAVGAESPHAELDLSDVDHRVGQPSRRGPTVGSVQFY